MRKFPGFLILSSLTVFLTILQSMDDRIIPNDSVAWIEGQKPGDQGAMKKTAKLKLHDVSNFHVFLAFT
jgi:hypothetical protein